MGGTPRGEVGWGRLAGVDDAMGESGGRAVLSGVGSDGSGCGCGDDDDDDDADDNNGPGPERLLLYRESVRGANWVHDRGDDGGGVDDLLDEERGVTPLGGVGGSNPRRLLYRASALYLARVYSAGLRLALAVGRIRVAGVHPPLGPLPLTLGIAD